MIWWVLKRKTHVSWLITYWCAGLTVGIYLAKFVRLDNLAFYLIISVFLGLVSLIFRNNWFIPIVIVSGALFGAVRGAPIRNDIENISKYYGKSVLISGYVCDDVDGSNDITFRLCGIVIDKKSYGGIIWVSSSSHEIKKGDEITINGKLKAGFGSFLGVIYRAEIIKVSKTASPDFAGTVRDRFSDSIRNSMTEPESDLGIGFLLGQRKELPADLVLSLQAAGLTHIVVASGYNLTILVRLARRLFERISKYLSILSAFIMILAFISITGLSPSMVRAGLVSSLSLLAWYYGRRFHPITLLVFVMAITLLINPSYIWGDLGWQLSFMAFAGVMILAPLAGRYFFGDKKPTFVGQLLTETISAQIVTMPIIIASFGQISNIAVISNLLILPLVPLAMLLTFLAGIGGLLSIVFIGLPANWLLGYMIGTTRYLADLPWAVSEVSFSWIAVVVCYAMITGVCFYFWRKTGFNLREVNLVE